MRKCPVVRLHGFVLVSVSLWIGCSVSNEDNQSTKRFHGPYAQELTADRLVNAAAGLSDSWVGKADLRTGIDASLRLLDGAWHVAVASGDSAVVGAVAKVHAAIAQFLGLRQCDSLAVGCTVDLGAAGWGSSQSAQRDRLMTVLIRGSTQPEELLALAGRLAALTEEERVFVLRAMRQALALTGDGGGSPPIDTSQDGHGFECDFSPALPVDRSRLRRAVECAFKAVLREQLVPESEVDDYLEFIATHRKFRPFLNGFVSEVLGAELEDFGRGEGPTYVEQILRTKGHGRNSKMRRALADAFRSSQWCTKAVRECGVTYIQSGASPQ